MRTVSATALLLCIAFNAQGGALVATKVPMRNGADTVFMDASGAPLSAGSPDTNGDGHVLEFGYYDAATIANPFAGTWVPLTGEGLLNFWRTTIGDDATPDGRFDLEVFFQPETATGNNLPPSTNIPMALRFYDNFALSFARNFNTVSNTSGAWNWKNDGTLNIFLDNPSASLVWEGGAASAYRTTIPVGVPEPSAALLAACGVVAFLRRMRNAP
jgi:hypothetical protein